MKRFIVGVESRVGGKWVAKLAQEATRIRQGSCNLTGQECLGISNFQVSALDSFPFLFLALFDHRENRVNIVFDLHHSENICFKCYIEFSFVAGI